MVDKLQVVLDVVDKADAVQESWFLPVELVTHQINRQPVVISLPNLNKTTGGQPSAYAIDFGMLNEMMTLSGVHIDSDADPTRPNHSQLADVIRTSWRFVDVSTANNSIAVAGGLRLSINEGEGVIKVYRCLPLSYSSTRKGGGTSWEFKLTLQVVRWPVIDGSISS